MQIMAQAIKSADKLRRALNKEFLIRVLHEGEDNTRLRGGGKVIAMMGRKAEYYMQKMLRLGRDKYTFRYKNQEYTFITH